MTILIEIIGWIGMVLLLSAYLFLTLKKLQADRWAYQLMNLTGGICIAINSFYNEAYPPAVLNFIWFIIGVGGFVMARKQRNAEAAAAAAEPQGPAV